MKKRNPKNKVEAFEQVLPKAGHQTFVLRLYISGATQRSMQAINSTRRACEEHLKGRYTLQVIDIYQQPARASRDQIVATPTLMRVHPVPLRRFIGNLADASQLAARISL